MLDDFCLEQPIVYKTIINSVKNNKISHAYLIETNGYSKSLDFALAIAKYFICPNNYCNNKNCDNCNICKNIDKRQFIELKLITTEGQWIKKSQLDELQNEFLKKSIVGNKKVYIIKDAEKLNVSSSNSLLKFLEEPEENIIAILITNNINNLLDTIISRCQLLNLKPNKKEVNTNILQKISNELFTSEEEKINFENNPKNLENIKYLLEFVKFLEDNNENTLIYINKYWNNYFKEKELIYIQFLIMSIFYKDILNFKLNRNIEIFNDYYDEINYISQKNQLVDIINKINLIINLKDKIKFNINPNSLMDKLIINFNRRV